MGDLRTIADDETCRTCTRTFKWHLENQPRHPFNSGQDGAKDFLRPRRDRTTRPGVNDPQRAADNPPRVVWPNDPVLRVALISKGILTADDLRMAEDMLRTSMGLTEGRNDGESAEEARRGEVRIGEAAALDVG